MVYLSTRFACYSTLMDMTKEQRTALAGEVASRLRAERARVNLTLREAGEKAGIHYVSISRYEQGKLPTLEALYSLAHAYGIEPGVFLPSLDKVSESPGKKPKRPRQ